MTPHKIMVVDDNTATRRMVRNALQRRGHDVVEAADGKSARALMRSERPRLVLQDLMLPDADGFVLVGELRAIAAGMDVSILAFSGFVSELSEARVSSVGFDDMIAKPIAPSRLIPLVEAHLPAAIASGERFGLGRRLVIADDDPIQLKLAMFRLSRLGFEVTAVPDGRAALDAIRRVSPHIVVSDVMMPELDGFGLAIELRKDAALRQLPLLLMTSSYVDPGDRDLARRAGASDLVPRTPELGELLVALRSVLVTSPEPSLVAPELLPELELEHNRRVFRQLERQVMLNSGLAKRCSSLASELTVLSGIAEAVLEHQNLDDALDDALAECFDAGGISVGALYLLDGDQLRVRSLGNGRPTWGDDDLQTFFGRASMLHEVIRTGRARNLQGAGDGELLARAKVAHMLVLPLAHLGEPLGALMMASHGSELGREDLLTFVHGVAVQISHALALGRAYSQREVAERRATEHAALLDALFTAAPDIIVQVDLEGFIRFANHAIRERLPAELFGTRWLELIPLDERDAARKAFDTAIATGEPSGFETQGLGNGNGPRWFAVRYGPIRAAGKVTGVVVVARDVSDKKQAEIQLVFADRMASVGTLAAGVAHEINNPLASVIANLDMAIDDITDLGRMVTLPADLVAEMADARVAANRVREIVRDLKIFSRSQEEHRGPVDVEAILDSTIRMAWNELRHRAQVIKVYGGVPVVEAHEARLGQVFLNLIINAAQAVPEGNYAANTIRVTTSVDAEGRVVVAIADTGSGIPEEVRPRLFSPFFTTKPVGVGTGLGLAISQKIVSSFGGTLTYETEVGVGTEFRVTLPVAASQERPRPAPLATRPAARRGMVLVIDDEESLCQALRRFLSAQHDVTALPGAQAGIDLITSGKRYDVILCDVMMPQVTGMEFYAAVAKLDPAQAAKIVFLTGGAFTVAAREFLDSMPNVRLEKPFDLKLMRQLVNDMIR